MHVVQLHGERKRKLTNWSAHGWNNVRTNEKISVGIVEGLVLHGGIAEIHVDRDTLANASVSRAAKRVQTFHEIYLRGLSGRHVKGFPS